MRDARSTVASLSRSGLAPRAFAIAAFLALGVFMLVAQGVRAQTPSPTATPSATSTPERRLELAPIEAVDVQILKSLPPQYQLMVTSGLPGGCAAFDSIKVDRTGTRIAVTVMNSMPVGNVPCTAIYGYKESSVNLGADFAAGATYTVVVNEGGPRPVTKTFTTASVAPAPDASPTPTAPQPTAQPTQPGAAPSATVPQPANVGTGGADASRVRVETMAAVTGAAVVVVLLLSVVAMRARRRG